MRGLSVILLFAATAWGDGTLYLKSGPIHTPSTTGTAVDAAGPGHFIVQFSNFPSAATRAALEQRGVRVLGYVPDFGLMVSAGSVPDLGGLGVVWVGTLAP